MKTTLTGASGLLGANLALHLLQLGHQVRCTRRKSSRVVHLDEAAAALGRSIEWVEADLADRDSLTRAFSGADVVFHCAAQVLLLRRPTPELIENNVEGTRRVITAMQHSGAGRLIHCSSVVACGVTETAAPATEEQQWNFDRFGLDDGYCITKHESQELVLAASAGDHPSVDGVVVNPTYLLGPLDARPSSGQLIIQAVRRKVPGHTDGYNCFVDVRDVCRGMVAAADKGRRGQCYILGGHNLTYQQIFDRIGQVAGVKPPRFHIPRALSGIAGWLGDLQEHLTGKESLLNSTRMRYAYCQGFRFSSDKAIRELGYSISPIEPAIADAIAWFRQHGML